jgi:hypothetical protein
MVRIARRTNYSNHLLTLPNPSSLEIDAKLETMTIGET